MKTSKKSKFLSFILSLTMVFSFMSTFAVPIVSAEEPIVYWTDPGNYDISWYGDGSATTYTISTAEQLAGLSVITNGLNGVARDDFKGKIISLNNSISLSGKEWMQIGDGNCYDLRPFNGTFNGGNNTIGGIYINNRHLWYQGLFGYAGVDSIIKNVSINGTIKCWREAGGIVGVSLGKIDGCINAVNITCMSTQIGGIVGHKKGGTISNCYNTGNVTGEFDVGGIVGENRDGTILNCHNKGNIKIYFDYIGGIVGSNWNGTISNCYNTGSVMGLYYVGGIVGHGVKNTISNCHNTGNTEGKKHVGGIVAHKEGGAISNCYNTGSVNAINKHEYDSNAGGIVGLNIDCTISNCHNTGNIKGASSAVGGIVGGNYGSTVSNCYNTESIEGDRLVGGIAGSGASNISNCYNIGSVKGDFMIGGIVGYEAGNISNCYNTGSIKGRNTVGGIVAQKNESTISNCYNIGSVESEGERCQSIGGIVGNKKGGAISNCYYNGYKGAIGQYYSTTATDIPGKAEPFIKITNNPLKPKCSTKISEKTLVNLPTEFKNAFGITKITMPTSYSSSNTSKATISNKKTIQAIAEGTSIISGSPLVITQKSLTKTGFNGAPVTVTGNYSEELSISDKGNYLDENAHYIAVANKSDQLPIKNAKVYIDEKLYTANEDGYVKYDGKFGKHTVTVKVDGYNTKTLIYNLNRGESRFFYLDKSKNNSRPYVTMLSERELGKDLLNQTLFYAEGSNDSCKLQIEADWGKKTPSKYVIYQDGSKMYESTSKTIDFKPGKVFTKTNSLYLKLVATDGTESGHIKIGMCIHGRSSVDDKIEDINKGDPTRNEYNICKPQKGKVNDSNVTQIFPGDFELEFSPIDLSIYAEVDPKDGSRIVKGALGLGKDEEVRIIDNKDLNSQYKWRDFKKYIDDLVKRDKKDKLKKGELKGIKEKLIKKYNKLGDSKFKNGKANFTNVFEGDFNSIGYIEIKLDKNGQPISVSGGLIAEVDVSKTYGGAFFAGPVPIYYDITGKLDAGIMGELGYSMNDRKPVNKFELTLTPEIILGAGVGIKSVASVGVDGGAKLKCKITPDPEGTLTPYANIRITALFIFDYSWTLATKDFKLWPNEAKALNEQLLENKISNDSTQFNWMSQDFAKKTTEWNGGNKLAIRSLSQSDGFVTLQDNILPTSEPQFVQLGNKLVMTFQAVDTTRSIGNNTVLMYSYYENGVWSNPSPVWDTKTSDMYANMISVNNNVYVVWQKARNSITSDNAQTAMSQLCSNSEIGFAKWDNIKNTFVEQQFITNNDTMDSLPIITSDGTKVTAVWANNKDNVVYGVENGYSIMKSDFDGKSWTSAEMVDTVNDNIVELAAGYDNEKLTVAYSSANKDNPTYTDAYCIKDAQKVKLTESTSINTGLQFVSGKLFWQSNGVINTYSDGETSKINIGDETVIPASYKLVKNSKKTAITWAEQKDGVETIYASILDGVEWSNPIAIFSLDKVKYQNTSIDDFKVALSDDGSWKIIMKTQIDETTSLAFTDVNVSSDLSLDYISALKIDKSDNIQNVDCYITNNGESVIDNYSIDIVDEQGNQYAHEDINLSIKPGKTEIIPIKIDLNKIKSSTKLTVSIQSSSDTNTSNNSYTIALGNIDISLEVERYEIDNSLVASAHVRNDSAIGADVTLKLIEDTEDGNVVETKKIDMIDNSQSYNYNFTIDKSKIDFKGQDMKRFYLKVESDKVDPYLDDNTFVILVYNDIYEKVTGVTLSNSELNMKVSKTHQLEAKVIPENSINNNVSWESSDPSVASVSDNGLVTALKSGKTTVTTTTEDGGYTAECIVNVVDEDLEEKYKITYSITSSWDNYKSVNVKITNTGEVPIEAWSVDFISSGKITQIWDANISEKVDNQYAIHCMPYNAIIPTNSSAEFGMIVTDTDLNDNSFKLHDKIIVPANDKVSLKFNVNNDWESGLIANIEIANLTNKPINNWELSFNTNFDIESMWPYPVKKNKDGSYTIKVVNVPINEKAMLKLQMQGVYLGKEAPQIRNIRFNQINP